LVAGLEVKRCPVRADSELRGLCHSDIIFFFDFRHIADSPFPYVHGGFRDGMLLEGSIEYPVLTGLFMWGTARAASTAQDYLSINAVLLGGVALLIAWALARLERWRALLWSLAPALALYAFLNWDLLAVGTMVAGIWSWSRNRTSWAAGWIGIGCAFKLFPGVLLLPLSLDSAHKRGLGAGIRVALVGCAVAIGINLPFTVANPGGWAATYRFHQEREPNYDSIWGLATPSWSPGLVNTVSAALTLASFAAICAYMIRRTRRSGSFPFLGMSGALIAVFLLWAKVHSPQYSLWILPFLVLIGCRIWWWVAYAVIDMILFVSVFAPLSTTSVDEARPWVWLSVFGRALLLGGLAIAFARADGSRHSPTAQSSALMSLV
jgi:uncharacterized membrane protein